MVYFNQNLKKRVSDAARIRGKRGAAKCGANRLKRVSLHGVDADTLRYRALDDRRGAIWREWTVSLGDGVYQRWQAFHAVGGRTDQFDVFCDGLLVRETKSLLNSPRSFPRRLDLGLIVSEIGSGAARESRTRVAHDGDDNSAAINARRGSSFNGNIA